MKNYTNIALPLQEATQKYQKLTDYSTKCCYLSLLFSLLTGTCAFFTIFKACVHYFDRIFIFSPNDSPSKTRYSICPFVSGKCGEEGKKLKKKEYVKNEKSFLDEIKNIFQSF